MNSVQEFNESDDKAHYETLLLRDILEYVLEKRRRMINLNEIRNN